jgi:putative transposase
MISTYQTIIVGDVSSLKLAKTRLATSVFDSGWGMLKQRVPRRQVRVKIILSI